MKRTEGNQRGAFSIEIAVSSVLFFASLLAVFDFGRMYFYESRLEYAVSQATRFATTGNVLENPDDPGSELTRAESIVYLIRELSGFPDLVGSDIMVMSIDSGGTQSPGAGGPGDVVTVTANYRIGIVTPYLSALFEEGSYAFSATTTFRNEEFPATAALPRGKMDAGEAVA